LQISTKFFHVGSFRLQNFVRSLSLKFSRRTATCCNCRSSSDNWYGTELTAIYL